MTDSLPIDAALPGLVTALESSRAVVLTAPAGAGKSTRVPPAILEAGLAGDGRILMLQPRRMAARAVAQRMAAERSERVGETVGYRIRFDHKVSGKTRILVVTEGILTRRFLVDPFLDGVSCVILDELHERSVHADLALAFCHELMQVRDDLRLVVMSATLTPEPVARYLGDCPVIEGEGRPHPVQVEHVREIDRRPLEERVAAAVRGLIQRDDDDGGDILVFLPGAPEIRRAEEAIRTEAEVISLYGALPAREQDRVLRPGDRRRVILATNIAETSLTVPGVTAVVDSGLVKQMRHDPRSGLDRLELGSISRQSAEQRAGRAGRTAPGRVVRLWTGHVHSGLLEADEPEIRRVDLAQALLAVVAFQPGYPRDFPFFEPPRPENLEGSLALLTMLGAIEEEDDGYHLTARGHRLAALPLHPRVGAVLLEAARLGLGRQGTLLAAMLGEREILAEPVAETTDSDLLERMDRFSELEERGFSGRAARELGIRPGTAQAVRKARDQLLGILTREESTGPRAVSGRREDLLALVVAGFPDRVCKRRAAGSDEAVMVGGRGVALGEESGVSDADLFAALVADAGKRGLHAKGRVRLASAITEAMLEARFPHLVLDEEGGVFDPERRAVRGVRRRFFADLLLREQTGVSVPPGKVASVLADEARSRFAEVFRPDRKARELRARLGFAVRALPDEGWPDVSDEGLAAWLPDICQGMSRFDELERFDWVAELNARVPHELRGLLKNEVPERIRVPSGSRVRIDYQADPPVLAVRLQEVFGLADTPRIARGSVPVVMHLLAPNGRPAQVTSDLKSFWGGTYQEVRKELRARYPKHDWPEDPWRAKPSRRPGKKR